jgi:S-adenosylmethionine-diacylglycerol 3-amino-3-carboxypropyl transferase
LASPAQYREPKQTGEGDIAAVLRARLERLPAASASRQLFAWQAFNCGYAPGAAAVAALSPAGPHPRIREAAPRVEVKRISMTRALAAMAPDSVDRVVPFDAQTGCGRPSSMPRGARSPAPPGPVPAIFRTAAVPSILPGRLAPALLDRWRYEEDRSRQLTAMDRSSIYGGFHLYRLEHQPGAAVA